MYKYKIETHLHTRHVSQCGQLAAEEIAQGYKQAGYDALVVTDHYNRTTFDYLGVSTTAPGDKLGPFLEGWRLLREECKKLGIRVFRGAELRFDECDNDYLFYGWRDDLLADPEEVFRMGIAAFAPMARSTGAIIVQAHPYRKNCTPAIARYLDGVEVLNMNPRHDSRNDRAEEYAREYGLLRLSGSDCHRPEDIALGGILTNSLPSDDLGMARLIRSRNYGLVGEG